MSRERFWIFGVRAGAVASHQAEVRTLDVNSALATWYQRASSKAQGGMSSYTQPFTIQRSLNGTVTVTLVNDKRSSNTVTRISKLIAAV